MPFFPQKPRSKAVKAYAHRPATKSSTRNNPYTIAASNSSASSPNLYQSLYQSAYDNVAPARSTLGLSSISEEPAASSGQENRVTTTMAASSASKDKHSFCGSGFDPFHVLTSPIFEFVVGAEEVAFRVHENVVAEISEPLKFLMTNERMEESLNRKAYIKDCEPDTFASFAKYAYMGLCGMAEDLNESSIAEQPVHMTRYQCRFCGTPSQTYKPQDYPFCGPPCRNHWGYYKDTTQVFGSCVVFQCGTHSAPTSPSTILCSGHVNTQVGREYPAFREGAQDAYTVPSGSHLSVEFRNRTYGYRDLSDKALQDHLGSHRSESKTSKKPVDEPLLRHAKLYALAHKYMVKDLQDICLHKLHRSLLAFKITDASIDEVIDLVSYTYSNTSDEGDILKGDADRMRDLVMGFVKDQNNVLMKYEGLRFMLGAGGPQTADFFGMMFGS